MKLSRMHSRGFTLIELLVVIGVLGILAAGLLATIDPFEQFKKARDTNTRNAALELYNATIRYYGTHGMNPWNDPLETTCADVTNLPGLVNGVGFGTNGFYRVVAGSNVATCLTNSVIADGELKTNFAGGLAGASVFLGSSGLAAVTTCFLPEAKSNINDATSRYVVANTSSPYSITLDTTGANCPGNLDGGTNECVQCFE